MAKKPASKAKKSAKSTKKIAKKTAAPKKIAKPEIKIEKLNSPLRPKNPAGSYTLSEFLENVKGYGGLPKRAQAKEICDDLARFIRDALKRGYKLPLLGLGKLYVRESKARTGRNPQTGETVQIPARKRVRFSAAKALKEAVLR